METYVCARHFRAAGSEFLMLDPGNTVAEGTIPNVAGDFVYEPATAKLLLDALRCSGAFCDIGALHGYFPCLVAAVLPDRIVHAFEANPEAHHVLERNFAINRVRGLAHWAAVNADGADVRFAGRSFVDDNAAGSFTVRGVRFDDFAAATKLTSVVVKIDVHGSEGFVLDGMQESLRTRISDILLEIHPRKQLVGDFSYEYFLDTLENAGFAVFEVGDFRDIEDLQLIPLVGQARLDFVDEGQWRPEHDTLQRMLFATKSPPENFSISTQTRG